MANKPKDIGTRQETNICNVINDFAGDKVALRIAQKGKYDNGDIRISVGDLLITGESKHCKKAPSEGQLAEFKRQTVDENANAGQDGGVLFVNVPNCSIQRMQCHMQLKTLLRIRGADRAIEREDIPEEAKERLRRALMADDEHSWICVTMWSFLNICWGRPAWEYIRD